MLQIYKKTGKGQRKCLDFSLSFQSGRASTIFGEGSNFSMKWAIFATSEFFFCMRVTKTLQHYKHYTVFLRGKSGLYLLYIIINVSSMKYNCL